jgi:hypothetical protein
MISKPFACIGVLFALGVIIVQTLPGAHPVTARKLFKFSQVNPMLTSRQCQLESARLGQYWRPDRIDMVRLRSQTLFRPDKSRNEMGNWGRDRLSLDIRSKIKTIRSRDYST